MDEEVVLEVDVVGLVVLNVESLSVVVVGVIVEVDEELVVDMDVVGTVVIDVKHCLCCCCQWYDGSGCCRRCGCVRVDGGQFFSCCCWFHGKSG